MIAAKYLLLVLFSITTLLLPVPASYKFLNIVKRNDQLPDGLIPWLVEHCTGVAEVMGLNPIQALISQLVKLCVSLR